VDSVNANGGEKVLINQQGWSPPDQHRQPPGCSGAESLQVVDGRQLV